MKKTYGIRLWWSSHSPGRNSWEVIDRVSRQHVGWQSITYKGKRYRLGGGIRTEYFINLDNPIGK